MRGMVRVRGYRIWRAGGNREECQLCKFLRGAKRNRKKRKNALYATSQAALYVYDDFLISIVIQNVSRHVRKFADTKHG